MKNAFDISLSLSKADRLRTKESAITHAMVISGVHLDPQSGKPVRYKVENSWGEKRGRKGFFVMTDRWFDEWFISHRLLSLLTSDLFCRFVYQVVVSKTLAPKELVKVFESDDRVVLPIWDPIVSRRAYILHQLLLITCRPNSLDLDLDSLSLSGL